MFALELGWNTQIIVVNILHVLSQYFIQFQNSTFKSLVSLLYIMDIRSTEWRCMSECKDLSHMTIFHFTDPSSNTFKNIYTFSGEKKLSVSACLKCQRKKIKPGINAVFLTLIIFWFKSAGCLIFRFVSLWSFSLLLWYMYLGWQRKKPFVWLHSHSCLLKDFLNLTQMP